MTPQTPKCDWVSENLFPDVSIRYQVKETLCKKETPFQKMVLVQTDCFGRMLLLDNIVQTTEVDEFIYHEMMTHVPMFAHPDPRRVLIVGGGDGGILREVLRHPSVEKVVMVEIDEAVIAFSKEHLPMISDGAFDDQRVEIVIADGAQYVRQAQGTFDVVIVDSPDPLGPAKVLFEEPFYQDVKNAMTETGVMVRQTGSTFLQKTEQAEAYGILKKVFPHVGLYVYAVPTYVGGFFSSIFASPAIQPNESHRENLEERFALLRGETRYYNPGIHSGAFALPPYVKGNLET